MSNGLDRCRESGCGRVSVVITAYNNAAFIAEAIRSVLAQTYLPDEILVVDDGSTDETRQVVSAFREKGVSYLYQPNAGAGAARNLGIRNTTGEFLAFLDADDLWLEDKCRRQRELLLARPEVALVSGGAWWWNVETGERWQVLLAHKSISKGRRDILVHNWLGNPSMIMVRRNVLEQVGLFDASLRWGQDWELWTRIVSCYQVAILPEPVMIYRSHPSNLSHTGRWQRLASFWAISRRAIGAYRPAWLRPFLLARAWSHAAYTMADAAREEGRSQWEQAARAFLALISYPYENGWGKAKLLARALVGESAYQRVRRRLRLASGGRGVKEG